MADRDLQHLMKLTSKVYNLSLINPGKQGPFYFGKAERLGKCLLTKKLDSPDDPNAKFFALSSEVILKSDRLRVCVLIGSELNREHLVLLYVNDKLDHPGGSYLVRKRYPQWFWSLFYMDSWSHKIAKSLRLRFCRGDRVRILEEVRRKEEEVRND